MPDSDTIIDAELRRLHAIEDAASTVIAQWRLDAGIDAEAMADLAIALQADNAAVDAAMTELRHRYNLDDA